MKIYRITKYEDASAICNSLKAQNDNLEAMKFLKAWKSLEGQGVMKEKPQLLLKVGRSAELFRVKRGAQYEEIPMGAVWASSARELAAARGWTPEYTG